MPGAPASLAADRARLDQDRASLRARHAAGLEGAELVREMSDRVDRALVQVFERLCAASPGSDVAPLALVATGGYGRRELAPRSDVDVLAVLPADARRARAEGIAERLHRALWDLGLEAGFAARTIDQEVSLAREDHTVRTALLDARFLVGDVELWNALERAARARVEPAGIEEFIAEKVRELDERRQRYGASIWLLEPHLKQGKGGLRDLQAALWVARARHGVATLPEVAAAGLLPARDARAVAAARSFLFRARAELHFATGRRDDRATFDHQRSLARAFGYRDGATELGVERFMRELYRALDDVARACDALVDRCAVEDAPGRRPRPERAIDEVFRLRNGRLVAAHRDVFERRPAELVRLFAVAEREGCRLHSSTRDLVQRGLHRHGDRLAEDAEAHAELWQLLSRDGASGDALRGLHESDVLGALFPDLARLRARVQHSLHHVYTVDAHTVFALVRAQRLRAGLLEAEPDLARSARAVRRPLVLLLGLLFHDLGKGLEGDHSAIGAERVRAYAARFGLAPADAADVEWLVREHLLMSHLALRRDLDDPRLIESFAREAGTRERLELLYLLTWADASSVSAESWTDWKAHLLRTLYLRAAEALSAASGAKSADSARRERLGASLDPEEAAFLAVTPARYVGGATPEGVRRHGRLWRLAVGAGFAAELGRGPGGESRLDLLARDRPGLLALFAAALAAHGIDVLSAEAHVLADGMALDTFAVREVGGAPVSEDRWQRAQGDLARLLAGAIDAQTLVRKRAARPSWAREGLPQVAPRVRIDNAASADCTVVDVVAEDRPGLLFDLAEALHSLGLGIEVARIATEGNRASDAFYVRDLAGARPAGGRGKVEDPSALSALQQAIEQAISRRPAGT